MSDIQFVVEDGTGKTDATSYIDVDYLDQYAKNTGRLSELDDYTIINKQEFLNQASFYVDLTYDYFGRKTDINQGLEFPRINCLDNSFDEYYDDDVIPEKLKKAVAETTLYLTTGADLFINSDEVFKREKVEGAVEIERFTNQRPELKIQVVEKLLNDISKDIAKGTIELKRC